MVATLAQSGQLPMCGDKDASKKGEGEFGKGFNRMGSRGEIKVKLPGERGCGIEGKNMMLILLQYGRLEENNKHQCFLNGAVKLPFFDSYPPFFKCFLLATPTAASDFLLQRKFVSCFFCLERVPRLDLYCTVIYHMRKELIVL